MREPAATPTDAELLQSAKGGDFAAFEEIVKRYQNRVYRLAFGITHSAPDAEEVAQETFLSAFRALQNVQTDVALGSWIFRITVNAALMRLRRNRRKPLLSVEDQPPPSLDFQSSDQSIWPASNWAEPPEDQALNRELLEHIEEAMRRLPDKYRLVLLLRDVEGRSNEEVAEALGLTLPTVKSRLHRARLLVREAMQTYLRNTRPVAASKG